MARPSSSALTGVAISIDPAADKLLDSEQLVEFYRLMYLSRRTDDREIVLKRQQKIFFQISCAGHEALLVAAGMALKPGYDWFFPYYRDRALCLALGNTVEEQLLQAVGAADDPASGGRQMPSHWSSKRLNIVTQSSSTATQCLHAVGCAEAGRYFARRPSAASVPDVSKGIDYRQFKDVTFQGDEVVYVSIGEGATSQGEFWESLNTASNCKLPVLYVIEDNGYAISTPVEVNTPGGNISRLIANFPNFHFAEIDGTDPLASYAAMVEAVAYCRAGKGPALVHGHVIRPYSHSLSDDEPSLPVGGGTGGGRAEGPDRTYADGIATRRHTQCDGDRPAGTAGWMKKCSAPRTAHSGFRCPLRRGTRSSARSTRRT